MKPLELLPIALGAAFYPTLLAGVVLVLGRPDPRRLLTAFVAGGMLFSVAIGFGIVAALRAGSVLQNHEREVSPAVDVVIGLVALALLWVLLTGRDTGFRERRRRKKEAKESDGDGRDPWSERILGGGSAKLAFVVGMVLNLPGALYIVALKDIAAADQGAGADVLYVVGFNLVMLVMAEVPLMGYWLAPERTVELVNGFNSWLGSHSRQLAMVLCGAAGTILVARGVISAVT